jgi:hypothetical protein
MNQSYDLPPQLKSVQTRALIVGVVALVISIGVAFFSPEAFFQSYLLGYVFWMQLALGCLGLLLMHHLVGGRWSFVPRRFFETGGLTIPLMAILFIPILVGMPYLYEWTNPEVVAGSHLLQVKSWWLNVPFFVGRTVLYFVIWIGLAYLLSRWSLQQDESDDPALRDRMKNISGPGMILAVLASTFAGYDWMMSTYPKWYSSMYGVIYMAGEAIFAIAFAILVSNYIRRSNEAFAKEATINVFNDLGNFLLAFVSFWAYVSFSQFLIIYSSNLPETVTWYLTRLNGGWQFVGVFLALFGWFIPFLLLLSRRNKRNIKMLITLALVAIVLRFVDLYWILIPTWYETVLSAGMVTLLSILVTVGIGGVWIWAFIWRLQGKSLLPLNDPRFQEEAGDHAAAPAQDTQLKEATAHD